MTNKILRLAMDIVSDPDYGAVKILIKGEEKIVSLDDSAVGKVITIFRSIDYLTGLTEKEKKQMVFDLLYQFCYSPFIKRGSMARHYEYIISNIFQIKRKNRKVVCQSKDLSNLSYSELNYFSCWYFRLHKAAKLYQQENEPVSQQQKKAGNSVENKRMGKSKQQPDQGKTAMAFAFTKAGFKTEE